MSITELIRHDDVEITTVSTGAEAMNAMHERNYGCVVLDLKLPDISGFELLSRLQKEPGLRDVPIVVFTGRELSESEETQLRKMARASCSRGSHPSACSTRRRSSCTA